jgi:hypothetical protein
MKNYYLGFCFLLMAAVSCRKVDDSSVFNKSADQRVNEALAGYQAQLSGAQYGWVGTVETKIGGNYTFYFSFNDSNRVKMLSSFDSTSAVTLKESSYRLKALQQPSLLFDTYSYLHVLADPNGGVNGGPDGSGLVSDFEFYFDSPNSSADTIALVGRYNGSRTKLVRATQAQQVGFLNGDLADGLSINKILTYYKRIIINNTDSTDAYVDTRSSFLIRPDATGNLVDQSSRTSYTLVLGGISFTNPVTVGNQTITELLNISFDAATSTISGTSGGAPVVIREVITPMAIDASGPQNWWNLANDEDTYWRSWDGFHQNGVDDAFGLANLTVAGLGPYFYMIYWPNAGGPNLDVYCPVFLTTDFTSLDFAYFSRFQATPWAASGIQKFTLRSNGTLNGVNWPTSGVNPARANRNLFAQNAGFYFVKVDNTHYDMVYSVTSKSWMRWELQP